jgi:hypothetical protein
MTAIATLAVNVVSNTGGLTKGLSKARSSMNQTGSSSGKLGGMLGKMNPLMIGIGAAAAGAAIAMAKINAAFERMDQVAKTASSLGMAAQELQGFQLAAQLGGVSADQMNAALRTMQKNVGEAAMGMGEAKVALETLGIDIDALAAKSPQEQFKTMADAVAGIDNPAKRSALAMKLFGEAGAQLIPMLEGGGEAIDQAQKEMVEMQGTLDAVDFKSIEDSNDAWTRLTTTLEGVWNQLAVAVAPAMEAAANVLQTVAGWVVKIVDAWNDYWSSDAEKAAARQAEVAEQQAQKMVAAYEQQAKAAEEAAKAREELEKKGVALAESLKTPVEMYNDKIAEFDELLKEGAITWETYKRAAKKATDELKRSEEFKKREIQASERQAVGVSLRGSTSSIAVQQKQVRTMEKLLAEEKLAREEEQRQTDLLQGILQNTGSANVVSI